MFIEIKCYDPDEEEEKEILLNTAFVQYIEKTDDEDYPYTICLASSGEESDCSICFEISSSTYKRIIENLNINDLLGSFK